MAISGESLMPKKPATQPFSSDPDNLEFVELLRHFDELGGSQQEASKALVISPGQLSRVKKGERHASRKHIRTLREFIRMKAGERKATEAKLEPVPLSLSLFSVDAATLKHFSPVKAVEAFRDLLWARATELRLPTTRVSISLDVNTPDGGIDASIHDDPGRPFDGDDLFASGVRYQIKTGEFKIWQASVLKKELFGREVIKFENLGSGVQEALVAKKPIVFVCFGTDLLDDQKNKAKKVVEAFFKTCGHSHANVNFLGATDVAGLFRRYPALCLQIRGHIYQGFRSWASWATDADMVLNLSYSPEFVHQIDELREELLSARIRHLRLIGEPGVGKSRLALELTRARNLSPVTLCISDGRALLRSTFLAELIQPDNLQFAILVVDECPAKDRAEIWNLLRQRSDRIRLITIDHGPDSSVDDEMRVFPVMPITEQQIASIISGYGIDHHEAKRWAAFCQGCPRIAHALADNLKRNRKDVLLEPATVNIWDRFVVGADDPNSEEVALRRIVLRHIALFERFGFEPPVENEARLIADLAAQCDPRITWGRFQSIVLRLRERRIVQGVTTLYITPRLFHIHLYREFWESYGAGLDIAKALEKMPGQLWNWFVAMLRYSHTSQPATKAIDRLLGPSGVFPGGDFPDEQAIGRMVMTLAETNQAAVLKCLQRTIGRMNSEQLSRLRTARQHIVWALERLAVWKEHFAASAMLLLRLAAAENSTHSNNSTGTFVELFTLNPGMACTQATANDRIAFLRSVLDSPIREHRAIALRAAEETLSQSCRMRTVGPEYQGVLPTIEFWMPTTRDELWDAYRDVWQMLVNLLATWKDEERAALIKSLIASSSWILEISRLAPLVLSTLEDLANDPQLDIPELLSVIRRATRRGSEHDSEVIDRLRVIDQSLEGRDFSSKLRRYVKYVTTDDSYDDDFVRTDRLERKLDELAQEAMTNQTLLLKELEWLISVDSSAAYCLAYRIEKLDSENKLLPTLIARQQALGDGATTTFLSGYLASIFERDSSTWESTIIEISAVPVIQTQLIDLAFSSGMTDRIATQIVEACRNGTCNPARLQRAWFSHRLAAISASAFLDLVEVQLDDPGDLWINAVRMFHTYYLTPDAERPLPEEEAFQLLTWPSAGSQGSARTDSYYWARLGIAFVTQYPERTWDFFTAVLRFCAKEWSVLSDLDTSNEHLLTNILKSNPSKAWECVSQVYSESNERARFGIQHWLSDGGHSLHDEGHGPIQFVPSETLFSWVDVDRDERADWLIGTLPKTMDASPRGRLTRDFVARYCEASEHYGTLWCRFHSGFWMGPSSDHYRGLRNKAHEWLAGEKNAAVIRWIDNYIEQLSADVSSAEIEEERDI